MAVDPGIIVTTGSSGSGGDFSAQGSFMDSTASGSLGLGAKVHSYEVRLVLEYCGQYWVGTA